MAKLTPEQFKQKHGVTKSKYSYIFDYWQLKHKQKAKALTDRFGLQGKIGWIYGQVRDGIDGPMTGSVLVCFIVKNARKSVCVAYSLDADEYEIYTGEDEYI
jgi:hypothetical protein